ncbi:hypothetical protein J3E74DRAFT_403936 [Bipolaris maydis]|nr:hypothetical protein J3E74DRAFT_403936 [Bipolaris maydis]
MEHRKHIEDELEELGHLHISIPGFFSASSGDVSDWRWVPLRGTRADLIVNIGWPDRRRELKVLMATYARTWRAQERSPFDRLGGITSKQFDIHKDRLQFVSVVLGFLCLNEEQLGFDPMIITIDDKRYIEISGKVAKSAR